MKKYTAEAILILVTLIWGATFVIIKVALNDISPMTFVATRFLIASIILFPFYLKIRKRFNKTITLSGILLGTMFFLGFATQTIGLKYTSATKSGFITGTFVIFTPIFQLLFEKKRPSKGNLFGVVLVLAGLIFLSSKGNSILDIFHEIGEGFNIGDFFTLLGAIFFAMYLVYLDILIKKFEFFPLVILQVGSTAVLGIIFSIGLSAFSVETITISISKNLIFALLYTSILATVVSTTLQTKFQKYLTPTKVGIILSFEPIFSAITAFIILNERISHFSFLGGLFIFTGLLVTELFDKFRLNNE
ncbi:MAG: DMT family transporter [Bacteroidetes bacterium]|nr:DMT family transporter [Bacteroidota bacterium]